MNVISTEKLPIKCWLPTKEVRVEHPVYSWDEQEGITKTEVDIEDNAREQAKHLANLPFAFKHIALMPDCHSGYGMPIGGVLATKGVVIPNAVGVDIGCGMSACKTTLTVEQLTTEDLKFVMGQIRERIPLGFEHHKKRQEGMPLFQTGTMQFEKCIVDEQMDAAYYQLGTLGGGNHFIEIQADEEDNVWIMVHSGSRNLGKQVCDYYNKKARELNQLWFSEVPDNWQLAFLPIETQIAKNYMAEMQYCVEFSFANRLHMTKNIKEILASLTGCGFGDIINIAHNYAAWENHFGTNVLVHRKGATRARKGEVGIIPGSQGTRSFIVEGLGATESFNSCSHGAGRRMSRTAATNNLDLEAEIQKLNEQGIIHGIRHKSDLDEAAGAYKDIDEVMENQKELVKILVKLRPLAVIKG